MSSGRRNGVFRGAINALLIEAAIIGATMLIALHAHATPSLTTVTAPAGLVHGSSVVISGAGFVTKPITNAQLFDDFDSGVINSYWNTNAGLTFSTATATQRSVRSTRNLYHNFKDGTSDDRHNAYLVGANTILSRDWYVSYWFYLAPNFDWQTGAYPNPPKFLSNVKFFRLWNPGTSVEDFVCSVAGWENQAGCAVENTGANGGTTYVHFLTNYPAVYFTTGAWHHLQTQYRESSALGVADGQATMWLDGAQVYTQTNLITHKNENLLNRPYNIGFYNSWSAGEGTPDSSDVSPNEFYMDDVYISTTLARVEIGDNATYASCTHREVQNVTAWSTTVATITYNQGSFATATGAGKYLFLTDYAGTRNDPGYALSVLDSVDTTSPTISGEAVTSTGSTTVSLQFTTDEVGTTRVEYGTTGSYGSFSTLDSTYVTAHTVTLTGLTAGTGYHWRALSADPTGNARTGSDKTFTTAAAAPTAPSGLSATARSATEIDLSWTDNSSTETGFEVDRSLNGSTWTNIATTAADVTSYSSVGLTASTQYYYRVRAVNAQASAYTSTANATTSAAAVSTPCGAFRAIMSNVVLTCQ